MSRQARVGMLVLAGVVLFFIALFAIANRSFLFSDTFFIRSKFNSVAGLQPGSTVQFQGVGIGRVETVALPSEPGGQIVVTMAISQSARHLIRTNTQAQIKTDGLVGMQIVVLVNPQSARIADRVQEGDFIPGTDPLDPYEVADKAVASVQRFELAAISAQKIMEDIQNGQGTLGKVIYDPALYNSLVGTTNETQRVMRSLGDNAEALVGIAGQATEGLNTILAKIDRGEGTIARMINDPAMYNKLMQASDTLQSISADLRAITRSAENAANWGALGAFRFAENMEALKHNFLFKRYFEERGYMNQANFEVREQALMQSYRQLEDKQRALQEWENRLRALEQQINDSSKVTQTRQATPTN